MANTEGFVLDSLNLNDQTAFALRSAEVPPPSKRILWLAQKYGDTLGDVPSYERRTVTLKVQCLGAATMDAALTQIGQITDKLQKAERTEGGIALTWTPAGGTFTGTFYVLSGEVTGLPLEVSGDDAGWFVKRPSVTIRLDCKPFLYGAEVTGTAVTNTDPMQLVTVASVAGDVPAEGRLIVTDAATQNRAHVEWGSEALTAAPATARTNLIPNPKAFIDVTGWAALTSPAPGRWAPGSFNIPGLPEVTGGFEGSFDADADAHLAENLSVVSGQTYRASIYAFIHTKTSSPQLVLRVVDGAYAVQASATGLTTTGAWTRVDVSFVAGFTVSNWRMGLYQSGAGTLGFYYTAALLEGSASLGTYFDGSTAGAYWTGTAHASTSTLDASRLILDSDTLTSTGYAGTGTTRTGAYDPGAAGNSVIRATLTTAPVAVCSTGDQTHVGSYRVKARVYASGTGVSTVRLAWRAGDAPHSRNAYATALDDQWSEVDLGTIYIPTAALGTQRWEGRIEATSTVAGDTLDVDVIDLVPSDRYGKARAPFTLSTPTVFSARDEFDQAAGGALAGQALPVGGAWAGAGDADDFVVDVASKTAQRTAVSDGATTELGRFAIAGTTTFTDAAAKVTATWTAFTAASGRRGFGIVLRYTDVNNYVLAWLNQADDEALGTGEILKRVAGVTTSIIAKNFSLAKIPEKAPVEIAARVSTSGVIAMFRNGERVLIGTDSALATGGALASGRVGFWDTRRGAGAATRQFDNFAAWVPEIDQVIFSGRSMQIRHDDTLRQNSAGTIYGRPPSYRGSRFFVAQAGSEGKITRVAVKARRNDIDELPDDNIADSTTAQVAHTPRYLNAPRS